MSLLPTVNFCGHTITRLISGGNTLSGFSHFSPELDGDLREFYTSEHIQAHWQECRKQGINTIQTRGDEHMIGEYIKHTQQDNPLNWIVQTASERPDLKESIKQIADAGAIAIYIHGTFVDNHWHAGSMDAVHELFKVIKDTGLPSGIGSHIPEVLEHIEGQGWETDFYMGCFYNLAKKVKTEQAKGEREEEHFNPEDPPLMCKVLRSISKPCIGFKLMAANRRCGNEAEVRESFQFAFDNLKPGDPVDVGMFQKYKNQIKENAAIVRALLSC